MPYRLKKECEAFEVVSEGPWDGRKFKHGETYAEVPEREAHKFERTGLSLLDIAPNEEVKKVLLKIDRHKKGGAD